MPNQTQITRQHCTYTLFIVGHHKKACVKVKHLDELNFCSATKEKKRDDKVNIYSLYSSVNCSLLKSHSNNDQLYIGLEKCHQMSNGERGYQKCHVTLKAGVSHLKTQVKLIQKSKKNISFVETRFKTGQNWEKKSSRFVCLNPWHTLFERGWRNISQCQESLWRIQICHLLFERTIRGHSNNTWHFFGRF